MPQARPALEFEIGRVTADALRGTVIHLSAIPHSLNARLQMLLDATPCGQRTSNRTRNVDEDGTYLTELCVPATFISPRGTLAFLDMQYKHHWTASASHELLEMLVDPDVNLSASISTGETTQRLYAYEVCDACQAEEFGYKIDGTLVSDFVYPTWFEAFHKPGSTQFDHGRKIKKPFELLSGGYISVLDMGSTTGWQQIHPKGEAHRYHMRPSVGSRRERRRTRRDLWLPSKPTAGSS
jgi:hypothetical protein